MNEPIKPTIEEIVAHVLKNEEEYLNNINSGRKPPIMSWIPKPKQKLLHCAAIDIMGKMNPPLTAIDYMETSLIGEAYALASKAYDTLLRERTTTPQQELSDEVKRIGLHCIGKIDESWEWRIRPDDSLSIFNIDNVLIDTLGKTICTMFNSPSRKPRLIVAPLIGVNYGALLNKKGKERLENVLTTGIPKQYVIQDCTIELDTEALAKKYDAYQRPIGEVRVEFGVKE